MSVNKAKILVQMPQGSVKAIFLRRVKRFSIEVELAGQSVWVHSNNSGSMLGLLRKGMSVIISPAQNKNRKLAWTLERVCPGGGNNFWVGVNTQLPNKLLKAAFQERLLDFALGYEQIRMEAKNGMSRIDAVLSARGKPSLWVECKNVTLVEDSSAAFPDAKSERAKKHLRELVNIVEQGQRAAMFYCVQRPDAQCFGPAEFIDAEYAKLFYWAIGMGVEVYPYIIDQLSSGMSLGKKLRIKNPLD